MIPNVISIKTDLKQRHFLTFRKELSIGTDNNSDLIINHPIFNNGSRILTVGFSGGSSKKSDAGDMNVKKFQRSMEIAGLRIRSRSLKMPAILLLLLLTTTAILGQVLNSQSNGPRDQNWSEIPLPAEETYGFCRGDKNHPEGVFYTFEAEKPGLYHLSFIPGGNGDGSTFSLSVNNIPILDSAQLPRGWDVKRAVRIPAELIRPGENSVEFRYSPQSAESKHWGIKEVEAAPIPERKVDRDSIDEVLKNSQKILSRKMIIGSDLGRLFTLLNELSIPEHLPEMALRKRNLFNTVQIRMIEKTQDTFLKIRSARNMGDDSSAAELTAQVRAWIPEEWEEGRRMINVYGQ